ncbi:MAG TPA: hypothetical protein ENN19_18835 [Chloroflexi bacterium]|nr:hypothetical protein [Chloroflexota bacterium]
MPVSPVEDAYAYRAELAILAGDAANLPPKIVRVAEIVRRRTGVQIRSANIADWDAEIARVMHLVNEAMGAMRNHVPMDEQEFTRFVQELRPVIDCDLILFAEIDGEPIGFAATIPDINQALKRIDGRLFPWGWCGFGVASARSTSPVLSCWLSWKPTGGGASMPCSTWRLPNLYYTRVTAGSICR